MSHDKHRQADIERANAEILPTEHVAHLSATPPVSTYSYSTRDPPPKVSGGTSPTIGTVAVPDAPMASRTLSAFERWAVNASDSEFNALAGAIGGFTSGIVTCPLDVIKTKLQAQGGFAVVQKGRHAGHEKVYKGLVGSARVIWKEEGLRGMYRGLGPIILGYLPTWAVWFTVYNKSKVVLGQRNQNSFVVNFWSSIIAGASSTIVTNPIWVIKTRLMSQTSHHSRSGFSVFPKGSNTPTSRPTLHAPWHYRSTLDAARKMYTTEGILSFYSGLTPALLGLTHVAVQFPAYEYLKLRFTGQGMGGSPEGGDGEAHWFGILSASILSKILASSATYPHEVIRTRLQTQRRPTPGQEHLGSPETQRGALQSARPSEGTVANGGSGVNHPASTSSGSVENAEPRFQQRRYKGIVSTVRTIMREEGWRAFYAGMGTNMMRAVPAATVTMLTYEYVMRQLKTTRIDARNKLDHGDSDVAFS
ncbi:hypothetical protein VTK73DRAFT_6323 [Phialemonium thermophilum]|uniref:Mitochondrial carrier protein n=1 Tax=Phialemonium thermophilum TaxID=223376 RepID=A0ABR3WK88_9PEZI